LGSNPSSTCASGVRDGNGPRTADRVNTPRSHVGALSPSYVPVIVAMLGDHRSSAKGMHDGNGGSSHASAGTLRIARETFRFGESERRWSGTHSVCLAQNTAWTRGCVHGPTAFSHGARRPVGIFGRDHCTTAQMAGPATLDHGRDAQSLPGDPGVAGPCRAPRFQALSRGSGLGRASGVMRHVEGARSASGKT
jgi:hypothetical protein